jgi:retron-type reverse transcriptase
MQFALIVPTVADRIAQEVVRRKLEPDLEPVFHTDSYGYRPGRSAIDAVRQARQLCWHYDWVLDIDLKGYFDSIDWGLLLKAVRHHTDCPWVLLYMALVHYWDTDSRYDFEIQPLPLIWSGMSLCLSSLMPSDQT